jgi:hypothetical protein
MVESFDREHPDGSRTDARCGSAKVANCRATGGRCKGDIHQISGFFGSAGRLGGLPRRFSVNCSPRRRAIVCVHRSSPSGRPRSRLSSTRCRGASASGSFTSRAQPAGRSSGQGDSIFAAVAASHPRLDHRQSCARATMLLSTRLGARRPLYPCRSPRKRASALWRGKRGACARGAQPEMLAM